MDQWYIAEKLDISEITIYRLCNTKGAIPTRQYMALSCLLRYGELPKLNYQSILILWDGYIKSLAEAIDMDISHVGQMLRGKWEITTMHSYAIWYAIKEQNSGRKEAP